MAASGKRSSAAEMNRSDAWRALPLMNKLFNPPLVLAAAAIFIALGGPAQAAKLIGGSDVRDSSLTGRDVRNNSLSGADIRNLRRGDFARGHLPEGPTRWVLVNRGGQIEAQSGGFRVANAYPRSSPGEGNVYIDSGDTNLADNGVVATIALENQYPLNADNVQNGRAPGADANPEFSGEITATRCAIAGVVACAPPDLASNGGTGQPTDTSRYFVVSPRNSDGSFTVNDDPSTSANEDSHKRFYVILSGPRTQR